MAAYFYRMTFKALVITSMLIFACQLAAVVAAARAVPADHSSAPDEIGDKIIEGELCAKGKEDIAVTTNGRRTWQISVFGSSPELLREPQALLRDQDQGEQKRLLGCGIFSGIVSSQK
ncbi:hypothetical protein J1N35_009897 [Gossypium stocksii]|uniref:Uncharacterized protein n=1 Tax=Gossypium stocksii TaxID=47602 RepID=A0A9D3VZD5_9ROSI|nr:hypothetical protein J1N35_009897 [Gossypium stocksii]